jgi:AAA lid domain/KAP family P-loop domain/Clp amino terminal domain, pathogenicity island component
MFEEFTDRGRRAFLLAQEEARKLGHNFIDTEHVLLGLIDEGENIATKSLESIGISLEAVRSQVEATFGERQQAPPAANPEVAEPHGEGNVAAAEDIPLAPGAEKVLELSSHEAQELGHTYIGTEHILLGLIREGEGVAAHVLIKLGAEWTRVREQVIQLLSGYQGQQAAEAGAGGRGGESARPSTLALDRFGRNLTAEAMEGKLDPVIGREKEIERVMQVLGRRIKNIPVLIGEPDVRKDTVLEGLAQGIVHGEIPETLKDKQLYTLDLGSLLAGDPGDVEEHLERILKEINTRGDIILFIDELHTLVGAGATEGVIDAASILKPKLARGELQMIGATTLDEYRKYIEKDAALERLFQPVQVGEPTVEHTIETLKGLRDRYEAYHRVSISDRGIVAAATLADRYINDRLLPAKAIDLIDEAGARMRIRQMTAPVDLREFDEKIAEARREKEDAINAQDFEKASDLRDCEKQLVAERREREKHWRSDYLDVVEVDEECIVAVIAEATGVPEDELRAALPWAIRPEAVPETDTDTEHQYVMLNDKPVENDDDDLLGTAKIAQGIASIIEVSRTAAPLVMAVDGGWGVGKSTLLTQIEARLPDKPEMVKLQFNAWTAQGENALESLIKSVLLELDPNIVRRWARKLVKRRGMVGLARIGFGIAARFLGVTKLVDDMWTRLEVDAQARNQLRECIQGMLSEWVKQGGKAAGKRTLVVFVDDLDRCSDDVVVRVCEAVKLYLDAPGLIFVLACDLSRLARGVAGPARGDTGEGRIYLEKIIQVAYRVPAPGSDNVRGLIGGYGKRSGISHLLDPTVVTILSDATEGNPRRIKRIINSFVLEHHLDPGWRRWPLNSALLIAAILLQQLYPSFYAVVIDENSGEDPIGDFLDYATVRAKALNPPPGSDNAWWSSVRRAFRQRGLAVPSPASLPVGQALPLQDLEESLSVDYPTLDYAKLARNEAFVALLKRFGEQSTRQALRAHLRRSPLGTERIVNSASSAASAASVDGFESGTDAEPPKEET